MPKENNNIFLVFLILVFSTCFSSITLSDTTTKLSVRGSGQIIPRFETLKFNEVRLRKGPSRDHPIDWVYKLKGLPLKIISEFDDWRKVEDFDGVNGWIHRSQLSRKRVVQVISSNSEIKSKPNKDADILALAETGVLLNLERCDEIWCRISTQNIKGWILRDNLFGILENELPN